jgi:3-oxoadipate enol-lactonase
MDALNINQAHLVGLSMGGMICQYIGANYPERALSLSLCDTASEMPPRSMWEERFAIAKSQGIAGLVDGTIKRWFLGDFINRATEQINTVRKMILATPVDGYLGCASAVRDMAQSTMLLKIKAPTMVLVGKQDPACTVDQATVLHRLIQHSSLVVIDQAAHLSNIEQPKAFNHALRGFLDSVA